MILQIQLSLLFTNAYKNEHYLRFDITSYHLIPLSEDRYRGDIEGV